MDVLYFKRCPNWEIAADRLDEAIAATRVDAEVAYIEVTTEQTARELAFTGSPTILVDGQDPFTTSAPIGWSCRCYESTRGLDIAPGVTELAAALSTVGAG